MSQRHIRKILQSRASLDDDDVDNSDDCGAVVVDTTRPRGSASSKRKKEKKRAQAVGEASALHAGTTTPHFTPDQTTTVVAPPVSSVVVDPDNALRKSVVTQSVEICDAEPSHSVLGVDSNNSEPQQTRAKKKADARRRLKAREEEDELVLQQAIAAASTVAGGAADHPESVAGANGSNKLLSKVMRLLRCPVVTCLNTRLERIRAFGADSVEDVGDGSCSRRTAAAAGTPQRNGLLPSRPQGTPLPKFRDSPLATPNRFNWPLFSTLGVAIRRAPPPSTQPPAGAGAKRPSSRAEYYVDWSDKDFRAAQENFDHVVGRMADTNQMLDQCLAKFPYHLPTLVQLHRTFATIGDAPNSQLMLDMALYTVGILLSGGRFTTADHSGDRQLPFSTHSNRLVFETIKLGVQLALKRGCNRTAFNVQRLLLSLDHTDPCATLLSWDYLALRAREWSTLLDAQRAAEALFHQSFEAGMARRESSDGGVGTNIPHQDGGEDGDDELLMARLFFALPGTHFCAALAQYLTEEMEEQAIVNRRNNHRTPVSAKNKATSSAPNMPTDILDLPPKEEDPVKQRLDSRSLMAVAMLRFPHVAWLMAEKLELDIDVTRDKGWQVLRELRAELHGEGAVSSTSPPVLSKAALHVATIFVERTYELFKTKEASVLLMAGAARLADTAFMSNLDVFQLGVERREFASTPLLHRYRRTSIEDVVGETVHRIPQELLNPAANMDEAEHDARAQEMQFLAGEGFPQGELDALQRFEAVFGPLPVDIPLQQRFTMYEEMLEQYRQEIGNETHPVMLFLQTLLPWNNLRDMALQRAIEARGVEDPVRRQRAAQRQRDEQVWRDAREEAQRREDEESSSDDGGW